MNSVHYEDILAALDKEIIRLLQIKNSVLKRQARAEEIDAMRNRAEMFSEMLLKASTIQNPASAMNYIKCFVLPWKNYLLEYYFPKTFEVLPEMLPDAWNAMETSILLLQLSDALEQDRDALAEIQ